MKSLHSSGSLSINLLILYAPKSTITTTVPSNPLTPVVPEPDTTITTRVYANPYTKNAAVPDPTPPPQNPPILDPTP